MNKEKIRVMAISLSGIIDEQVRLQHIEAALTQIWKEALAVKSGGNVMYSAGGEQQYISRKGGIAQ